MHTKRNILAVTAASFVTLGSTVSALTLGSVPVLANSNDFSRYTAQLSPLNNSGVSGTARLLFRNNRWAIYFAG